MQFRVRHQSLVGLHGSLSLLDQAELIVQLLRGDLLGVQELTIPHQSLLRGAQGRLVPRTLSLRLFELCLPAARIDLGEQVSLLHELPLGEVHLLQLSLDPCSQCHHAGWHHRPQPVEKQVDVPSSDVFSTITATVFGAALPRLDVGIGEELRHQRANLRPHRWQPLFPVKYPAPASSATTNQNQRPPLEGGRPVVPWSERVSGHGVWRVAGAGSNIFDSNMPC